MATKTSSHICPTGERQNPFTDIISRYRGKTTKAKSARAVVAMGVGTTVGRGTRLLKNVILAKFLLPPDQLGIMAIIMGFSMTFGALTEVGVKQSVIQNKHGATDEYLNAAWWIQLVRGVCLFAIASLFAPWISSFYDNPDLSRLLQVAFLAMLIKGIVSPRAYVLEKEFKFGWAVLLIQGSAMLGATITVGLALIIHNVWALVIGFVMEMTILCVLSFIMLPFRPQLKIHRESLRELIKFGRGMFGLPVLTAISLQSPVLILGKTISKEQLGLYSMAAMLADIPIDLYSRVIAPVLLPAFSEKQGDNLSINRGVFQAARLTSMIAMPLIAFMVCSATELLSLVYTAEWAAMAIPFAVLCMQIIFVSEAVIFAGMYFSMGKPHLQRRFAVIRAAIIIGLMYLAAVRFGPLGAAGVMVVGNLTVLAMQIIKAREVVGLDLRRYAYCYIPGLLLTLPVVVTFDIFWLIGVQSPTVVLAIGGSVFVTVIIAGVFSWSRNG